MFPVTAPTSARRLTIQIVLLALPVLLLVSGCAFQDLSQQITLVPTLPALDPTPPPPGTSSPVAAASLPSPEATLAPTWTAEPTSLPTETPTVTPTPGCQDSGQVIQSRFPSSLSWPDLAYRIYLPPCYGQDGRAYPVLYMLQGNISDDRVWDVLGLDEAAEAGIQDGSLPPMLIVMPEAGGLANTTSGGPWSYEKVIVDELLPFIEANYCAWREPAGRAIGGLSRGGYWSLEVAFQNPAHFGSVGGHAAALVDTYAGPTLDPKYTALTADLSTLRIYLDAGQNDWYLNPLRVLHDNLVAAGKEHAWVIQEGGHYDAYWSNHVADYLAWYAEPWSGQRSDYPPCPPDGS